MFLGVLSPWLWSLPSMTKMSVGVGSGRRVGWYSIKLQLLILIRFKAMIK